MTDDPVIPRTPNFWRTHRNRKTVEKSPPKLVLQQPNNAETARYKSRITLAKVSIQKNDGDGE